MGKILMLIAFLMMPLLVSSQSISNGELRETSNPHTYADSIPRGTLIGTVNNLGELILHLHVEDARLLLTDLLDYELIVDSIMPEYEHRDSTQKKAITLNLAKIAELQLQSKNCKEQKEKLEGLIANIREIGGFKDLTIDNAKDVIKKEKIKKGLAFGGGITGGIGLGILIGVLIK